MELNKTFTNGLWNKEINVSDFVSKNIAPYTGDASFLQDLPNVPNVSGTSV
mgnify:CR=1 FL=1